MSKESNLRKADYTIETQPSLTDPNVTEEVLVTQPGRVVQHLRNDKVRRTKRTVMGIASKPETPFHPRNDVRNNSSCS